MICGHSHSGCPDSYLQTGRDRILDVGVDTFPDPISVSDIKLALSNRKLEGTGHHSKKVDELQNIF